MVNKQMRQLRIAPHILLAPHPSASLAIQLLNQMCYQKGAGITLWSIPGANVGLEREVWLELNGLQWLPWAFSPHPPIKLEKHHHSRDKASPVILPHMRSILGPASCLSHHQGSHLLNYLLSPECSIKPGFRQKLQQMKLRQALFQNSKIGHIHTLCDPGV